MLYLYVCELEQSDWHAARKGQGDGVQLPQTDLIFN